MSLQLADINGSGLYASLADTPTATCVKAAFTLADTHSGIYEKSYKRLLHACSLSLASRGPDVQRKGSMSLPEIKLLGSCHSELGGKSEQCV